MSKRPLAAPSAVFIASILCACGQSGADFDPSAHAQEVMDWRNWRLEQLLDPSGYLNQTGLFWVEPGSYTFGSAPSNDIVFDGDAAAEIGIFTVGEAGVSIQVRPDVEVRINDVPVQEVAMPADTSGEDVSATHRSLAWTVVERAGRFGIRLRDFEHPFVATFGPIPYFDIDAGLRLTAVLQAYDQPRTANVGTVIEGLGYHPESPGVVEFEIDGVVYTLEAYLSGERLFYVFGDLTNRDDTYGAGRFLYSDLPGEDGITILDFNKAYSPPCAFNDFSTCPVASPRNRLPVRIEAGEKYDPALHFSANR